MRLGSFTLACVMVSSRPLSAQGAVHVGTAEGVRTARAVYLEIERAVRRRRLARRDTTVQCPPDSLEARGAIYLDRQQRIRRLDFEGGTEDHAEHLSAYFDTLGRVRFALVARGAVNGTQQEERVYYDEGARVIHRTLRQTHGPGYPFDTLSTVPRLATWTRDLCG